MGPILMAVGSPFPSPGCSTEAQAPETKQDWAR